MKLNDQKKYYRENALTQSDIRSLPECSRLEVISVRDKCGEAIGRIHKLMSRLSIMGDDDRRSLWFEVKGKKWEWYRITTAVYNDYHYLYVTGDTYDHHAFCDREDNNSNQWYNEEYLLPKFLKLESYIKTLVEKIVSDPGQYNTYVDKYLSPYKRKGLIRRSILNTILPNHRMQGIDVRKAISIYEAQETPTQFTEMTLRQYMRYWRIAYEAVNGPKPGDDAEVFRHSSKGHEAKDYDLNSEEDFNEWMKAVSGYHGFDIVYARVHMYPRHVDGKWIFHLSTSSYWNLVQCLKAVLGLKNAGINVELGEVEHILGILKETDFVEVTPYAYRYMQGKNVGSQLSLPYSDEIGKDALKRIIANTEWEKIETVSVNTNS